VFILKTLKVDCFPGFAQVFILKDLIALICTKTVQVSQVSRTKGLGYWRTPKSKNASKMLALRERHAIIPKNNYMPGVTGRQGKNR
jgi:hypothetical protein